MVDLKLRKNQPINAIKKKLAKIHLYSHIVSIKVKRKLVFYFFMLFFFKER